MSVAPDCCAGKVERRHGTHDCVCEKIKQSNSAPKRLCLIGKLSESAPAVFIYRGCFQGNEYEKEDENLFGGWTIFTNGGKIKV